MRDKLLTLAIAVLMVSVSLAVLPFSAVSEDVTKPFVERNDGYPLTYVPTLDQSCEDAMDYYTITPAQPWAQTFTATKSGELSMVEVKLFADSTNTVSIRCEIRATTGGVPNPTWLTYEGDSHTLTTTPTWYQMTISTRPVVVAGQTYAIVLKTSTLNYHWSALGTYSDGDGFSTLDGGTTWDSLDGENFGFRTYVNTPTGGATRVAWHSSGEFALAVTGTNHMVYRFTRQTGTWTPFLTLNAGEVVHDIVFDPQPGWGLFYLVGEDTNTLKPLAYEFDYDPVGGSTLQPRTYSSINGVFYGVERSNDGASNYKFIAVGENRGSGQPLMAWYDFMSGWKQVNTGLGPNDVLYDVCWDHGTNYYAVGNDDLGYGVVYRLAVGSTSTNKLCGGGSWPVPPLYAIDWNDDHATYNWAIMAGDDIGTGNIWQYDGVSVPQMIYDEPTDIYYDLDFFPSGDYSGTCQVVGMGSPGEGVMCTVNPDTLAVVRNVVSDGACKGVALKGPSSPSSGIVTSSSGAISYYPSALDQATRLIANAAYPHLWWIGFNDTASNSRIEQQVAGDDWYQFELAANYSLGWANCEIYLQAWYDNGLAGDFSVYPAEIESNRCLAFTLYYNPNGGLYTMTYPGGPEYAIGVIGDVIVPGGAAGEEIHQVTMPVRLGPQTRAANGNGFISGDIDTDYLKNNALLDANSWDFSVTVQDSAFSTANQKMYSEFGIDRTVSITVAGNPSGNAPPGSDDVALGSPSQITYSSNTNYWVNVSIPDLQENGVGPASILATYVAAANVNVFSDPLFSEIDGTSCPVGRAFTGANQPWCVWGNRSEVQQYVSAPGNGTTAFGPYGSNFNAAWTNGGITYTQVNWWISVPAGTTEGVYWAQITITIESEG